MQCLEDEQQCNGIKKMLALLACNAAFMMDQIGQPR
jgi:hypothetical protein